MKATISYLSPRFKFVPKGDFDSQSCLIMEYPETATGEKGKENKKITIFEKKNWEDLFLRFFGPGFVPGRPGTEEFVPGFLHLPLSQDKGTAGQAKLVCPGTKGQQDRETFLSQDVLRPLETL